MCSTKRRRIETSLKLLNGHSSAFDTQKSSNLFHVFRMVNLTATLSTLITANHILHYHNILDAYGHISVRNPNNASTFFLSAEIAPALVSSPTDLVEYLISTGEPVSPTAPQGYLERYIHSAILNQFPDVNSVLHSHSEDVIPYSVTHFPFQPIYHMAGFIGPPAPVFEIENYYSNTQSHDMLISDIRLGNALARLFAGNGTSQGNQTSPGPTLVLMRGHGFSTIRTSLERTVFRGYFAASNARVQMMAIELAGLVGGGTGTVRYLDERESMDASTAIDQTVKRPWALWVREVERNALYDNTLGTPPM